MTLPTDQHIFKRFDNEMAHLHSLVLDMGRLAVAQLTDAVQTLKDENADRAIEVIRNDKMLNDLDLQVDDEIARIIARRQPMAKDLREIIAVAKIAAELERSGDEARKIAGLTVRFFDADAPPPSRPVLNDIFLLAEYVADMLSVSIRAFDRLELQLAADVLRKGLKLEHELQSTFQRLSACILQDVRNVAHFIDLVLGIRALERFGGHAKNIVGHIVFIKNGTDVRHQDDASILRSIEQA